MKRWRIWLGIWIIFICGVAVGIVGTGLYIHNRVVSILHGGSAAFERAVLDALDWHLDLDGEQKEAMALIIADTHKEIYLFRKTHHLGLKEICTKGFERIEGELTPEQQAEFEELRGNIEAHMGMMHGPREEDG